MVKDVYKNGPEETPVLKPTSKWSFLIKLYLELPGSKRLGEKHTDTMSAMSVPWDPVPTGLKESVKTTERHLSRCNKISLYQTFPNLGPIPQAPALYLRECLLSHSGLQECTSPLEIKMILDPKKNLVHQFAPPDDLCKRIQDQVRLSFLPEHDGIWGLRGSSLVLIVQLTSPGNSWCQWWHNPVWATFHYCCPACEGCICHHYLP